MAVEAARDGEAAGPLVGSGRLGAVVAIGGASGLATEICASRLLAPFFGSSTIVWANIIGLILLYLSVGYWVGGRYADRHPSRRRLGAILLAAAVCVALLPLVSRPVLQLAVSAFASLSTGAVVASFFATLLLFAVPVTLLGMVSPFAIRLGIGGIESSGALAGRLYALSTMGSLVGTFVPAMLTIPAIGTQRSMIVFGAATSVAAVLLIGRRWLLATALIAALLLLPTGPVKEQPGIVAERESPYQYAVVIDEPDGSRRLQINEGLATHSVWRPDTVLTGGEWDMFLVAPGLIEHPVQRVLIIGNAGGTTARAFGRYWPSAVIDGVEIDPVVTELGREYMGLGDNPRLTVHDADGRTFLETTSQRWDLIIVDAYHQPYIPFHLATQEFFQLCRDHLTPGGALALNVERIPGDDALAHTIESTVSAVMPDAWSWPALHFNEMVVAFNAPPQHSVPALRRALDGDFAVLGDLFESQTVAADRGETPLTDDRAPVEWLTDRSLLQYIASGGSLNEQLLPTAPRSP